jgi:hypothetical protein
VFGISLVWGRDLRTSFPFSSLAHVPLGLILCFLVSLWRLGSAPPFPFLTCACSLGVFDLVFWNQFSVGSGSARSFPFLLAHVPLGFFILCFWISLVWGRDLRAFFPFPHLRVPWGFFVSCVLESV